MTGGYLPALDGLRGVSILLVMFSHAGLEHIVPGGLGVTLFFFISGFIITRLMIHEHDTSGHVSIAAFYLRRLFRIAPALLVYVAVSLTALASVGARPRLIETLAALFYFANYYHLFVGFSVNPFPSPFAILWSLSVEEHYYLFFPLLFVTAWKGRRRLLVALVLGCLAALSWRLYLVYGVGLEALPFGRTYYATDTRADSILWGAVLAVLMRQRTGDGIETTRGYAVVPYAALAAMAGTLLFRDLAFRESWRYTLHGVLLVPIVHYAVTCRSLLQTLLAIRPLVYVGRISYSLYLYHWLVFNFTAYRLVGHGWFVRTAIMMTLSFVVADASHRFVELPAMAYRRARFG